MAFKGCSKQLQHHLKADTTIRPIVLVEELLQNKIQLVIHKQNRIRLSAYADDNCIVQRNSFTEIEDEQDKGIKQRKGQRIYRLVCQMSANAPTSTSIAENKMTVQKCQDAQGNPLLWESEGGGVTWWRNRDPGLPSWGKCNLSIKSYTATCSTGLTNIPSLSHSWSKHTAFIAVTDSGSANRFVASLLIMCPKSSSAVGAFETGEGGS